VRFVLKVPLPALAEWPCETGFNLASAAGRIAFGLGADAFLGSINSLFICLFANGLSVFVMWPLAKSLAPLCVLFPSPPRFPRLTSTSCSSTQRRLCHRQRLLRVRASVQTIVDSRRLLTCAQTCSGGTFSLIPGVLTSIFGSAQLAHVFSTSESIHTTVLELQSCTLRKSLITPRALPAALTSALPPLPVLTFWTAGYLLGPPIAGFLLQAGGGISKGPEAALGAVMYAGALSIAASALVLAVRVIQSRQLWKKL